MKLTADNITVMSEHQQISDNVELVTKNIREYKKEDDLAVLENLKDLCIKESMTVEIAKMYRNIGMYHFYTNNFGNAIISMQLAVDLLRRENCTSLLIEYYSELGLVYFYNHEYLYSKRYYEDAEELLLQASDMNKNIIYSHYLRYGILLSNMQDYFRSKLKLEKALLFAEDDKDTGLVIMNIGLLFKRQKDLKAALRYYSKALCLMDENNIKTKGIVYNNIAEVYKILGQYGKALSYIDKAFNCITDNDLSRMFIFFNTFTEIKILIGERESVLDEFLGLLARVKDFHLYKSLIIEGIRNMIVIGCEDRNILKRLEDAIVKLIESNTYDNEEYIKELKVCLGNIRLSVRELKN
ncbi:MAG TPA: tetratricopeptide repeat protein [Clostridia bacterium]|nr:tetratricopeptide repeat protein [Clostridia bacterium]